MESRAHALAAGLFILLLGAAAAAAVWWLSERAAETRDYTLVATRSVTGLNNQAQVRYRGIRSGKVQDIDLDPQDRRRILVTIRIDADVPVTAGTTARLNYQGVTGIAYVDLDDTGESPDLLAGRDGAPPRIPLEPSQLDELSDAAMAMAAEAKRLMGRVNTLLDERNVTRIAATLENVERLTADADAALRALPGTLAQLREVVSESNLRRLQAILDNVEQTTREGGPLAADMRELVATLKGLAERVEALGTEAGVELVGNTLPRTGQLLQELTANSRQLKRVLDDLESSPQAILFGRHRGRPGPGEAGFVPVKP